VSAAAVETRGAAPWGFVELVKFVSGITTLAAELAAARLIAPAFGASTIVWANTIAIALAALAIGYWLGGRLADRHPTERAMARGGLAGALMVALIPLVAIPLLGVTEDSLGEFAGSFLVQLVLVAPPLVVLGAITPWSIRLRVDSVEGAGGSTGRLYALSTAGGLVGNFAAALALIPLVGTTWTFIIAAGLLAVVCVPRAWSSRPA
jgi:predicted membrane-bound spermidine synthase